LSPRQMAYRFPPRCDQNLGGSRNVWRVRDVNI
jgi:hypothetical protein